MIFCRATLERSLSTWILTEVEALPTVISDDPLITNPSLAVVLLLLRSTAVFLRADSVFIDARLGPLITAQIVLGPVVVLIEIPLVDVPTSL